MQRNIFNDILILAKDVENYHNLNHSNTTPIYVEGSKYYSLFEPLVTVNKIAGGDYLITFNDWHGFEREIHVKKDKFDLKTLKKQVDELAHIINNNTAFMNIIDDLPPPEFCHVSFKEWEEFKNKSRDWKDRQIVVCRTHSTVYISEPLPLWGVHRVNFD